MKVYRVSYYDADLGCMLGWAPNKRAAKAMMRYFDAPAPDADPRAMNHPGDIELVEIPTNKAGLIRWLNANFNTDNG